MLPPVTKQYDDHSTDRQFAFVFHCDRCGKLWESESYPFSMADATTDSRARALLWETEHAAAYERANTEALFHFSKCPTCGRRICDDCFCTAEDACKTCTKPKGGWIPFGKL